MEIGPPRLTLFIPCAAELKQPVLEGAKVHVEWIENDGAFGEAFSFAR